MALQARLKPYEPTKGNLLRGITIASLNLSFDEGKVVGPINAEQAKVLRTVRQRPGDPNSALAFDVLEEAEMKKLVAVETRAKLGLSDEALEALRDLQETPAPAPTPDPAPQRTRRPRGS